MPDQSNYNKPYESSIKREYDITYLNKICTRADDASRSHSREVRSNILLYANQHFAKVSKNFRDNLNRDYNIELTTDNKIRISINFIHTVMNKFMNNTLTFAPGVMFTPYDSQDIHSIKDAELTQSVWRDIKEKNIWDDLDNDIVQDYFVDGEVWAYTYWDFDKGEVVDYEETGEFSVTGYDEMGMPIQEPVKDQNRPIVSGQACIELWPAADVFLEDGITDYKESSYVGVRKLVNRQKLEYMIKNDPYLTDKEKTEKIGWLNPADKEEYSYMNNSNNSVTTNEDIILVRYLFYKPCPEFPMGKIFITVKGGILWPLELQKDKDGRPIFPVEKCFCDRIKGSPRGYSIIKQIRPQQVEVNRAVSKTAETQITLGDDKIITTAEGGITEGQKLQGVRNIIIKRGYDYKVLEGRTGEQYLNYIDKAASWIFTVADMPMDDDDKTGNSDITATLYKSMKQKKKYVLHAKKIESFYKAIAVKCIELAKSYMPEQQVIKAIGRNEAINVAEFKGLSKDAYQIRAENVSEDVETMMGKYLTLRDALQYASKDLGPSKVAYMITKMPFINEEDFSEFTIDETEATNICLALDRGEEPAIYEEDNNDAIVAKIGRRMRQGDFKFLEQKDPSIRPRYQKQYDERKALIAKRAEELKKVNQGMIPTDGALVDVGIYVNEPTKDGMSVKTTRAKMPQAAIQWTMDRLGEQGAFLQVVEGLPIPTQIDILGGANLPGHGPEQQGNMGG